MGSFEVISPGLQTLVQDAGRLGYQQYGVSTSGVMDSYAYELANMLVNNLHGQAVLEAVFLGPSLRFNDPMSIAITGGAMQPLLNNIPIAMWRNHKVKTGDVLSFKGIESGCRTYISFSGGIEVKEVLASKSTYTKAKIGGVEGRAIRKGDLIEIGKSDVKSIKNMWTPKDYIPTYDNEIVLRVILGPQDTYFTQRGMETFLNSIYTVTNDSDRMGYRLSGDVVEHVDASDIISDGLMMGAIQIPGNGMPIIMMADRQTTGGYPKIAYVSSVDLCKLSQAKANDIIKFKAISIEESQALYIAEVKKVELLAHELANQSLIDQHEFKITVNGKLFNVSVDEIAVVRRTL